MNKYDFDGRTAIVTGGAQGIGHAVAEELALLLRRRRRLLCRVSPILLALLRLGRHAPVPDPVCVRHASARRGVATERARAVTARSASAAEGALGELRLIFAALPPAFQAKVLHPWR